jgi:DinB family protein
MGGAPAPTPEPLPGLVLGTLIARHAANSRRQDATVTMDRRTRLLTELRSTSDGFLASLDGLAGDQWTWRPAPDVWSVMDTAEHVAVVLRGIERLATTRLLTQPIPETTAERITDDQIVRAMFDRSRRRDAPETVRPTGRWAGSDEVIGVFRTSRDGLALWLEANVEDLRRFGHPHPVLGLLDGAQWMLFAAAHTERHTRQVSEIRQAQGFPG